MNDRSFLARHLDPNPSVIRPTVTPPAPTNWKPVLIAFGMVMLLLLGACEGFLRFVVSLCRNAGMDEAKCGPAPGWKPLILHDITGDAGHGPNGHEDGIEVAITLDAQTSEALLARYGRG